MSGVMHVNRLVCDLFVVWLNTCMVETNVRLV